MQDWIGQVIAKITPRDLIVTEKQRQQLLEELLEKQKKGKKRMKMVGAVAIPQKAFVSILKTDTD